MVKQIHTKQKGFSPIIIVLVLVIVGAVGFGTWYITNREDKKAETTNQTAQNQTDEAPNQPESNKHLTIKEWGVKFDLPSNLSDATYRISQDGSTATISTASLEKYPGCQNGSFMSLQRAKDGEAIGPSDVTTIREANSDALIKVGEYYYLFTGAQMSCTQDPAGESYLGQTITDFSQAVKTLQPVQ